MTNDPLDPEGAAASCEFRVPPVVWIGRIRDLRSMKKFLFWPYQVYVWLIFLPLAICLTLLFSILTVIFAWLVNPDFASRVFAVTWARVIALLTPIQVQVDYVYMDTIKTHMQIYSAPSSS